MTTSERSWAERTEEDKRGQDTYQPGILLLVMRHLTSQGSELPPLLLLLLLLLFTKGRNWKENYVESLRTKQAMKETACVWRALFPAGSVPGSSGKPIGCWGKKKKTQKNTHTKNPQLALVWFSAKPCLFKFALGALRGAANF